MKKAVAHDSQTGVSFFDVAKAFNRLNPRTLIEELFDLIVKVLRWLDSSHSFEPFQRSLARLIQLASTNDIDFDVNIEKSS